MVCGRPSYWLDKTIEDYQAKTGKRPDGFFVPRWWADLLKQESYELVVDVSGREIADRFFDSDVALAYDGIPIRVQPTPPIDPELLPPKEPEAYTGSQKSPYSIFEALVNHEPFFMPPSLQNPPSLSDWLSPLDPE